jgi:ankyrin repeat protein
MVPLNLQSNWPIREAAKLGQFYSVRDLLTSSRVDPNVGDAFPLRIACEMGHKEVARLLLKRCDPRSQEDYAMRWAAYNGHLEVVQLLYRDGRSNINCKDNAALK